MMNLEEGRDVVEKVLKGGKRVNKKGLNAEILDKIEGDIE